VLDFMRLLWSADHALHRTSKKMESVLGVTGPQRLVVRIVGRFPGIPQGEIARLLHLHPSTLTGIVERLERGGFVRRRSDPRDRRRFLLGLTAEGRHVDSSTPGTIEAAVQRTLQNADPADVAATRRVLETMVRELEREGGATPARRS
jgi:DNA-binding MarR family transcriptional regulator